MPSYASADVPNLPSFSVFVRAQSYRNVNLASAAMSLASAPNIAEAKRSRWIVLDAAALIAGTDSLYALGGLTDSITRESPAALSDNEQVRFFVTPDVATEARDPRARERLLLLERLGCVVVKAPSAEAVAEVAMYAKRTGDYSVLSSTDMRVLALTFMLDVERNGRRFLKEVPEKRVIGGVRIGRAIAFEDVEKREAEERERIAKEENKNDGWTSITPHPKKKVGDSKGGKKKGRKRTKKNRNDEQKKDKELLTAGKSGEESNGAKRVERPVDCVSQVVTRSGMPSLDGETTKEQVPVTDDQLSDHVVSRELISNLTLSNGSKLTGRLQSPDNTKDVQSKECNDVQPSVLNEHTSESISIVQEDTSEEDDGIGWINEENLEEHLARDGMAESVSEEDHQRVACVTTDFAMQNTMLQMGLKLLSVDGRRTIRQIRSFALRCHSCSAVTRELHRKFCENCGNATMHRVAFKIDKKGVARAFLNPKKKPILRGSKYPIPLPRGGRHNQDLVLSEDQIDPVKQRRLEKQRQKLNVDVLDPSSFYNAGARFNPHDRPLVVGYGKRNPNEVRSSSKGKR